MFQFRFQFYFSKYTTTLNDIKIGRITKESKARKTWLGYPKHRRINLIIHVQKLQGQDLNKGRSGETTDRTRHMCIQ